MSLSNCNSSLSGNSSLQLAIIQFGRFKFKVYKTLLLLVLLHLLLVLVLLLVLAADVHIMNLA